MGYLAGASAFIPRFVPSVLLKNKRGRCFAQTVFVQRLSLLTVVFTFHFLFSAVDLTSHTIILACFRFGRKASCKNKDVRSRQSALDNRASSRFSYWPIHLWSLKVAQAFESTRQLFASGGSSRRLSVSPESLPKTFASKLSHNTRRSLPSLHWDWTAYFQQLTITDLNCWTLQIRWRLKNFCLCPNTVKTSIFECWRKLFRKIGLAVELRMFKSCWRFSKKF